MTDIDKRRGFLKQVVGATSALPFAQGLAGGVAATSLAAVAAPAAAPAPAAPVPAVGYVCFSQDEAAFIETMVNIMCPADDLTPNGVDCGLPIYIDRQLAGDFGRGSKHYARGPWIQGRPQQGYQLPMTPEQWFKAGVEAANQACTAKYGKPFDQVAPADANAFLDQLGAGKVSDPRLPMAAWFNELVYPLFTQACFADPIYGGNNDKVFWKMVGYPGLPATNTVNMVQYRGKPFPGAKDPKSMADFS
ncbi:MAG TPA: gluconate 2-dehydrogenase subunit 3 family protein [Steroidobacteraceae bacterium]|jgi:gluconate 2-dehydrogenase gamma chain